MIPTNQLLYDTIEKMKGVPSVEQTVICNSAEETEEFAAQLATTLTPNSVLAFTGDLGAGKTEFVRAMAQEFGITDYITSPTFTIVNEYKGTLDLYHFDVYRIADSDEMYEIGYDEYIDGDGICVIEWAEFIEDILPPHRYNVTINKDLANGESYRKITIEEI